MEIEVSVGEIVDKLSILQIKKDNITDETKLSNIKNEFEYLYEKVFNQLLISIEDYNSLLNINKLLWDVEDEIREKERLKEFDEKFIELARKVYFTNDERAFIKKEINTKYNSGFVEEKSYKNYR
jgi:hypothetical protein